MQVGMIGLGRTGAAMVRRFMRGGHQCVVYDVSRDAMQALAREGAYGAASLDELVARLVKPQIVGLMVSAAAADVTLDELGPRLAERDIVTVTTSGAPSASRHVAFTTSTVGRAAACGVSSVVTAS